MTRDWAGRAGLGWGLFSCQQLPAVRDGGGEGREVVCEGPDLWLLGEGIEWGSWPGRWFVMVFREGNFSAFYHLQELRRGTICRLVGLLLRKVLPCG